jgi:hypothetical protein
MMELRSICSLSTMAALAVFTGCTQTATTPAEATAVHDGHDHASHEHGGHSHDGWWCGEHGVPEEVCALCNSKIAAEFQKKGDWCDEHDRPDSQCFACHPEFEERFADQYEAKYGERPAKPAS